MFYLPLPKNNLKTFKKTPVRFVYGRNAFFIWGSFYIWKTKTKKPYLIQKVFL